MARLVHYAVVLPLLVLPQLLVCDGFGFLALVARAHQFIIIGEVLWHHLHHSKHEPTDNKEEAAIQLLNEMSVRSLEREVQDISLEVSAVLRDLPGLINLERSMAELAKNIRKVDESYKEFLQHIEQGGKLQNETMSQFARNTLSWYKCGLSDVLVDIHLSLLPNKLNTNNGKSILSLISTLMLPYERICDKQRSVQQILYYLYQAVVTTELKAYLTMRYAHQILNIDSGDELEILNHEFEERYSRTTNNFKKFMRFFKSREILRCDPPRYKRDVTYTELNGLFWKHIASNDLQGAKTCAVTDTMNKFISWWEACSSCDDAIYNPRFHCPNKYFRDCESRSLRVCPTRKGSINDTRIRSYDKESTCEDPVKVEGPDMCVCVCDGHRVELSPIRWENKLPLPRVETYQKADAYFDLDPSSSDTRKNYVVTGARLRKINHTVTIEIQEGELLPFGEINRKTVSWRKKDIIDPYQINSESDEEVEEPNYHRVEWSGKRTVNLFTQAANTNEVVTGLGFKLINDRITLQIYKNPFDFNTGKIQNVDNQSEEDTYIFSKAERAPYPDDSTELLLTDLDVPSNTKRPSVSDSRPNNYLKFQTTSLETDLGQTTVPFIDIQEVRTNPPAPLSGAGLYHKGRKGYAGFLALKLLTYDFSQHF